MKKNKGWHGERRRHSEVARKGARSRRVNSQLTETKKQEIKKWHWAGKKHSWIASKYNVSQKQIQEIIFGKEISKSVNEKRTILNILTKNKRYKVEQGWSRKIGAGFVADDIKKIETTTGGLLFTFDWGTQTIHPSELNLRETEEAIKFLKRR